MKKVHIMGEQVGFQKAAKQKADFQNLTGTPVNQCDHTPNSVMKVDKLFKKCPFIVVNLSILTWFETTLNTHLVLLGLLYYIVWQKQSATDR